MTDKTVNVGTPGHIDHGASAGVSELEAMVERENEFRSWWAKNHPFDWWAKERDGEPLGHGDRLRVWGICRQAWMSSNAI